ncbi:ADP-ribosylglycohydrolase family protein [Cellulophaga baltica]|uniref:ADP-ribosylglycohydrolase family protein n=1 Tax=Cellulophaga baltica TaxID=76594 RepID=UPI0003F66ADB|nr:ADP-ribosylglycohydrolase family protein [Cellulophaga baltica]
MEIATKDKWKTIPMDNPKRLDVSIFLNFEQLNKLKLGLVPNQMEDKWFVYFNNDNIYFNRSWTGYEIFKAKLNLNENGCEINEFRVEQNLEKYKEADDERNIYNFKNHIEYLSNREINNPVKNGLWGLVIGDALGVPVEFKSRDYLKQNPLTDMIGFGTYNQPEGTWSDDSSLAFCLADELTKELNLQEIGNSFVRWFYENHWTPHGKVFDIGISTREAIIRLKKGEKAELAGNWEENSNGNGSLMRILPLLFEVQKIKGRKEKYDLIKKVSSITHGHIRSCLACFYYLEIASFLSSEIKYPITDAYKVANHSLLKLTEELDINPKEIELFDRITGGNLAELQENSIQSSGYVIHTLEASIWCLLTTKSYKEAVLKAINLGEDTDTTGAVVGGLAGLFYGINSIPKEWIGKIARKKDIEELTNKLSDKYKIARC